MDAADVVDVGGKRYLTDIGVLGVDMVPSACESIATPDATRALAELLKAFDV